MIGDLEVGGTTRPCQADPALDLRRLDIRVHEEVPACSMTGRTIEAIVDRHRAVGRDAHLALVDDRRIEVRVAGVTRRGAHDAVTLPGLEARRLAALTETEQ